MGGAATANQALALFGSRKLRLFIVVIFILPSSTTRTSEGYALSRVEWCPPPSHTHTARAAAAFFPAKQQPILSRRRVPAD